MLAPGPCSLRSSQAHACVSTVHARADIDEETKELTLTERTDLGDDQAASFARAVDGITNEVSERRKEVDYLALRMADIMSTP